MEIINQHLAELKSLCDKYHVEELYAIGSITKESFSDNSDIDFLVQFEGVEPIEYFDNYMDLKADLKKLFSRDIDLVEKQTIKNPILKESINRDKILLYGREDSKVAI
ncbi:nucleotidyltransferase family protein [Marivirga sp.]|uniref:nucleotidyltransferase family protein n=1 Tax=Marivirga sp. TaxID=2018662 RepID=UPI003DA73725